MSFPLPQTARLFANLPESPSLDVLPEVREAALVEPRQANLIRDFATEVDDGLLEVWARAKNPKNPLELRDLWLGRVECLLGQHSHRPDLAKQWRSASIKRDFTAEEVLGSRTTVRFVKELFNWFFRDDLYGDLRSDENLILSSGAIDEEAWGLPVTLKECIRYALNRDWYGYSDSRGRYSTREAIAAYENARMETSFYQAANVAVTMGGTIAVSSLADFVFLGTPENGPAALCGIPNYPPLVESIARRRNVQLVPLRVIEGEVSLAPLIAALTPTTPLVLLQTAQNPTGAIIPELELARLVRATSPSTLILLDECHEWLGPIVPYSSYRTAPNVVRISSASKTWSAPGLKIGWILADAAFIASYYEYASTTFGGPPSLFYTLLEVTARMERWLIMGLENPGPAELNEFESSYQLNRTELEAAYRAYRTDRIARERALDATRRAVISGLTHASALVVPPRYSINTALKFPGWNDSYLCFRDLLRETGVAVFPGILTLCLSDGIVRITTARQWTVLSSALQRLREKFGCPEEVSVPTSLQGIGVD